MGIGSIGTLGEVICLVLASVVVTSPIPTDGGWEVTEEWVVRYDEPKHDFFSSVDVPKDMVVDESGNVYVTGGSLGNGTRSDITTVSYDTDGNERWVARYDGPISGQDGGNAITMGPEGNIFVTGYSEGNGTDGDITILAYTSNGTMLWEARHDADSKVDSAGVIRTDPSGNVYVTGSSNIGDPYPSVNYATVAYDSSGNELWSSYYSNFGTDYARDLAVDSNGNVYVTGKSDDVMDAHYATIAYDSFGSMLWLARYDYSPEDRANAAIAIDLDSKGNVYVGGGGWGGYSVRTDYVTVAYNQYGEELWVAGYNGPQSHSDQARDLIVGPEGNVYITGDTWDGKGSLNETVVAYDSSGNELWTGQIPDRGSRNWGTPRALAVDDNGHVYIMGDDFITAAYDSSGNELWMTKYDNPSGMYCLTRAIGLDAEGNVYVTGYCSVGEDDTDYVTVKYSQKWSPKIDLDIDPDTLNLDSKGRWITAYIEISGGYGVELMDVSTIVLNETIPAETWPTEIGDYDEDRVPDLMVKFNRTAVQEMLSGYEPSGTGGRVGYYVTLTVSGSFYDGTNFSCSDTIRILAIKKTGIRLSPFSDLDYEPMTKLGPMTAIWR